MPNTFGTSTKKIPLVDPRSIRENRTRFIREEIPNLDRANGFYVPTGENRARVWILVSRAAYDLVRGYGTSYQLDMGVGTGGRILLQNLVIVQARCVSRGLASDPNAVYLVELTDKRGILCAPWFEYPTNRYYNVLSPAYPRLYYNASLNSGSAWTWQTLTENLWAQMSFALGSFPGLPALTFSGLPANFNLDGVSCWKALCNILEHLGLGVACDLTNATQPYSIVSYGATDATFDTLTTTYAGRLRDDQEWIDVGSGRVPGTVIVYFRRVNEQYGTEETIRRDDAQWATNAVYNVAVNAPSDFTGAVGTGFIWDDFTVRYDVNNLPLASDVASASAIAHERVRQYFNVIYSQSGGYMNRTYSGLVPFYAGSQIDGVCWRQDYSINDRDGWVTQIMRGDIWDGIYD